MAFELLVHRHVAFCQLPLEKETRSPFLLAPDPWGPEPGPSATLEVGQGPPHFSP